MEGEQKLITEVRPGTVVDIRVIVTDVDVGGSQVMTAAEGVGGSGQWSVPNSVLVTEVASVDDVLAWSRS